MKKAFLIIIGALFFGMAQAQVLSSPALSETQADNLRKEFQKLSQDKDYQGAMKKGVQVAEAFLQQNRLKEATNTIYQMELLMGESEAQAGKTNYPFRFMIANQRLRKYTAERKPESSKGQLYALQNYIGHIQDESFKDQLLLSEAEYYDAFGMQARGIERYKELLQRCLARNDEEKREDCYKDMLGYAERNKIPALTAVVQKEYAVWQEAVNMAKAARELETLRQDHQTLLQDLREKEKTISNNKKMIIALCGLIVGFIAALVFILFFLIKKMYQIKKLKKNLKIVNESNAQKSHFISNISTQITPYLDNMKSAFDTPSSAKILEEDVDSLSKRIADMQTYISLEETREESYPVNSVDIKSLCEKIMAKAKPSFQVGVEDVVIVPKINMKTNPEALDQVITYLLERASFYTETGKITLEFKKRNARTGQFIITDTGAAIDSEKQEELFKPFGGADPGAPQFDWLLPICQLIAYKLNGTLKVDPEYRKGTRFVLDLCS